MPGGCYGTQGDDASMMLCLSTASPEALVDDTMDRQPVVARAPAVAVVIFAGGRPEASPVS